MEDKIQRDINIIIAFRQIVKMNYPDKFEVLKANEELWFDPSITKYQAWLDKNISLSEYDIASITLYSLISGRSIDEVKDVMDSRHI